MKAQRNPSTHTDVSFQNIVRVPGSFGTVSARFIYKVHGFQLLSAEEEEGKGTFYPIFQKRSLSLMSSQIIEFSLKSNFSHDSSTAVSTY